MDLSLLLILKKSKSDFPRIKNTILIIRGSRSNGIKGSRKWPAKFPIIANWHRANNSMNLFLQMKCFPIIEKVALEKREVIKLNL